ncbi:hypothetical protein [Tenacibaculum aiptasiae]|uniref:hypothetical protein n=1 Tax=Tenacibaculum aiptasiae TaxID=426481 RepID=UPI00232AD081|nr:hypothetical protein [Tenacibaculum aiptasiae]
MKKRFKKNKFLVIVLIFTLLYNCKTKPSTKDEKQKSKKEYIYTKEIIRFDYGNNEFKDQYVYIGKGDTIGFQYIYYKDNVIDTSKSVFYNLDIKKIASKKYSGSLTYYYDSITDGQLSILNFDLRCKINGKTNYKTFTTKNKNSLKLEFESDNDTIIGIIYVYHSKDSKEKGKVRLRRRFIPVDNFNKTNNPFIGLEPE